jgi:hypothetical protein
VLNAQGPGFDPQYQKNKIKFKKNMDSDEMK